LLATAHLARPVADAVAEPHFPEQLTRALLHALARVPADQPGHHHVLHRVELGQQMMKLKNEADRLVAHARQLGAG
jgi:hypothetical protein